MAGMGEGLRRIHAGTPACRCEPCGKFSYVSRSAARKARRRVVKGAELCAYPCPHNSQWWHLGHLLDHQNGRDRLRAARHKPGAG